MTKQKRPTKDDIIKAYSNEIIRLTEWVKCLRGQLNEANDAIKYYANSFYGDKQKDGTYLICTRENACGRVEVTYNPNIAKDYLKKWSIE